ncbi:hypothetical protein V2J52_00275 [Georgenia sp. MJ173]|uniref:hypothetical protein n=1 Tax=Georgenia sunbinii TaxID=3117728 RepID=UPI002F26CCC0
MRTTAAAAIAALLVLLGALLPVQPAGAATGPPMEFSEDGAQWATELPALFPTTLLVPGEHATAVVWIRHHGPGPAQLTVTLGDDLVDPAGTQLREWLTVHLNGQSTTPSSTWHGPVAEPGAPLRLGLDVAMSADAPASTRAQAGQVLSRLGFREVAPSDDDNHGHDDSPEPGEPGEADRERLSTSGVTAGALLLLGAFLVGAGITVRLRRRPMPTRSSGRR